LKDKARDDQQKAQLSWTIQKVEALAQPVTLSAEVLKSFAGSYGRRSLSDENGSLWYVMQERGLKIRTVPMTADTLMLDDGRDILRLRIEKDAAGKVTGLTALYDDGRTEKSPRTGG